MGRRKDRGRIDSQFIIGVTLEDHFKEFLDEVCSKIVRNGYFTTFYLYFRDTPSLKDLKRHEELKEKALKLFRIFYFGENMSSLERAIEQRYLLAKQEKYIAYLRSRVN